MRRNSAISRSAISSRSTPIRSRSWSMPTASASSTKAPISAITPMPNTAAWCWSSPGQFAWQVFDQKVKHLQRDEYKIRQITKVDGRHDRGTLRRSLKA